MKIPLSIRPENVRAVVNALMGEAGLFDEQEGTPAKDPTAAERQRRYRAARNGDRNADDRNADRNVTPLLKGASK